MSLYYDSKKRKVRPWIYVVFGIIPVVMIYCTYVFSQNPVKEYKLREQQKLEEDIFARF
ncbi:MAG: hypothetical protein KBD53_11840 [Candidatus Omnitrophica bacterium]|nr:hypothetical protein [Candidatus Omnitrophota bacterium]